MAQSLLMFLGSTVILAALLTNPCCIAQEEVTDSSADTGKVMTIIAICKVAMTI